MRRIKLAGYANKRVNTRTEARRNASGFNSLELLRYLATRHRVALQGYALPQLNKPVIRSTYSTSRYAGTTSTAQLREPFFPLSWRLFFN